MTTIASTLLVTAFSLLAVVGDVHADPFAVVSGKVDFSGIRLPEKLSELDGWGGIRVSISVTRPGYCHLFFPKSYGLGKREELAVLVRLSSSPSLTNDLDCFLLAREEALNQLRGLAINFQDCDAASLLLKKKYVETYKLDGDLGEEFPIEYQLTILEKFEGVGVVLDADTEDYLSRYICMRADYRNMSNRIRALIKDLEVRHLGQFAAKFKRDCAL